ncbi:hypothetical protein VHEMI10203 [[Torrubiella] hemipterigena]|uniref:Uncharacterized protein n=1 Tax=[Torrubiella] hemipterigena TaxID=1531966 RepID=A0A0A1TCE3_9HYPO|nr:hypothetical protein VHEMI10203 [[Torrubiella] hemipterigena]
MPRNGDGSSHNGPFEEAGHNIAHGTEKAKENDQSHKVADLPEGIHDKGAALPGMNASGGGNAITNQPDMKGAQTSQ